MQPFVQCSCVHELDASPEDPERKQTARARAFVAETGSPCDKPPIVHIVHVHAAPRSKSFLRCKASPSQHPGTGTRRRIHRKSTPSHPRPTRDDTDRACPSRRSTVNPKGLHRQGLDEWLSCQLRQTARPRVCGGTGVVGVWVESRMVAWCDSLQAMAAPRVMKPTWEIPTLLVQRRIATPLIYTPLTILQRFWEVQASQTMQHVVLAVEPALPGAGPYLHPALCTPCSLH